MSKWEYQRYDLIRPYSGTICEWAFADKKCITFREAIMTIEIVAFIFGALLILIGILGGGFEAKEIKIPKIAGIARFFSFVVGISFILLGISIPNSDEDNSKSEPVIISNQKIESSQPIHFIIKDEMSKEEILDRYEGQTKVHIDGKLVGTITVNPSFPKSSIIVSMPKGRYNYVVETSANLNENGSIININCIGDGQIDADSGKEYLITGRYDGNKCLLWLEQTL